MINFQVNNLNKGQLILIKNLAKNTNILIIHDKYRNNL
jgi:hypothetical protein